MKLSTQSLFAALCSALLLSATIACTPNEESDEAAESNAEESEELAAAESEETEEERLDPELAALTERVAALRQALRAPDADIDALLSEASMSEEELEEALYEIAANPQAAAYYETLSGSAEE